MTEGKGRAAVVTEASLLLAVIFLGTNPVAVKLAVLDVPPLPFVAIRFILAGLLLCRALAGPGTRGRAEGPALDGGGRVITLVGVASGVVLLGESLTVNKILGGAVILLGVYLARRQ